MTSMPHRCIAGTIHADSHVLALLAWVAFPQSQARRRAPASSSALCGVLPGSSRRGRSTCRSRRWRARTRAVVAAGTSQDARAQFCEARVAHAKPSPGPSGSRPDRMLWCNVRTYEYGVMANRGTRHEIRICAVSTNKRIYCSSVNLQSMNNSN
jgi:hypothetical protein